MLHPDHLLSVHKPAMMVSMNLYRCDQVSRCMLKLIGTRKRTAVVRIFSSSNKFHRNIRTTASMPSTGMLQVSTESRWTEISQQEIHGSDDECDGVRERTLIPLMVVHRRKACWNALDILLCVCTYMQEEVIRWPYFLVGTRISLIMLVKRACCAVFIHDELFFHCLCLLCLCYEESPFLYPRVQFLGWHDYTMWQLSCSDVVTNCFARVCRYCHLSQNIPIPINITHKITNSSFY